MTPLWIRSFFLCKRIPQFLFEDVVEEVNMGFGSLVQLFIFANLDEVLPTMTL